VVLQRFRGELQLLDRREGGATGGAGGSGWNEDEAGGGSARGGGGRAPAPAQTGFSDDLDDDVPF